MEYCGDYQSAAQRRRSERTPLCPAQVARLPERGAETQKEQLLLCRAQVAESPNDHQGAIADAKA